MERKPCIIGIDFGTTSLSAVVINVKERKIEQVLNYETNAYIPLPEDHNKEQSIETLTKLFLKLLESIITIPGIYITGYGFTGQMHGVIGLNEQKEAVTNLVTWQDKSGDTILPTGTTLLDEIRSLSHHETLANGYGIVTLYKWIHCDKRTDINTFCTVADYFSSLLTESREIKMSSSMAHSIGLFDLNTNNWDTQAIKRLKLEDINFPEITESNTITGYTNSKYGNAPVACAIGDNQSSFLGSVGVCEEAILLNIGTGTQLSFLINKNELQTYKKHIDGSETQLRPFNNQYYLIATSFTNGGTVYKSLFNFFKKVGINLFDLENIDEKLLWKKMEMLGNESLHSTTPLVVSPLLEGERKDPHSKGSISNLCHANFHPGDFISGFLKGLSRHYYHSGYFPELEAKTTHIYGSGNGLKKNALFTSMIETVFKLPVYLIPYNEEAAVGAALNAAISTQLLKDSENQKAFLNDLSTNTN